jgi:hypothetical protein
MVITQTGRTESGSGRWENIVIDTNLQISVEWIQNDSKNTWKDAKDNKHHSFLQKLY